MSLNALTDEATKLKNDGRLAEAIDAMKSIVDLAPDNIAVLHNYAAALQDAGRNREAVGVFRKAFKMGLDAPESWLVFARALSGMQEFREAEKAFIELIKRKPLGHEGHREFAQLIWMQTGDREKAIALLNRAIAAHPNEQGLHIARAQVFGQTGEPDAEYMVLREAHRLSSGDPYLAYAACSAALNAKQFNEALTYGAEAAQKLPNELGAVAAYGTALLAVGDARGAQDVINVLREKAPNNQLFIALEATAWRLLGDERYHEVYDFDRFVLATPLDAPAGWGTLQSYLDDLTAALEKAHRYRTHPFYQSVRHGSQISAIDGADDPAMRAFREAATRPVQRFVDSLPGGEDPLQKRMMAGFRFYSSWSISLPPKGFHVNHVHPEGWISSACHIRPPEKEEGAPRAGWLKFGEPGVATSPALAPEKYVEPQAGVMITFPSYMWHGTEDFSSPPSRVTIAADIVPAAASV